MLTAWSLWATYSVPCRATGLHAPKQSWAACLQFGSGSRSAELGQDPCPGVRGRAQLSHAARPYQMAKADPQALPDVPGGRCRSRWRRQWLHAPQGPQDTAPHHGRMGELPKEALHPALWLHSRSRQSQILTGNGSSDALSCLFHSGTGLGNVCVARKASGLLSLPPALWQVATLGSHGESGKSSPIPLPWSCSRGFQSVILRWLL